MVFFFEMIRKGMVNQNLLEISYHPINHHTINSLSIKEVGGCVGED